MKKAEILSHWRHMKRSQRLHVAPIPYKHEGSTFDHDSIRITGSKVFIDSVLSRLSDLLEYENDETRLQLVYKESQDRETGANLGSYNAYIQVHERGDEAKAVNRFVSGITGKSTPASAGY